MLTGARPEKPHALRVRPAPVKQGDLTYEYVDEPAPEPRRRPQTADKIRAMLGGLSVGMCVRVNRKEDTVRSQITAYRKLEGNETKRFLVRQEEAKAKGVLWSKVWRTA